MGPLPLIRSCDVHRDFANLLGIFIVQPLVTLVSAAIYSGLSQSTMWNIFLTFVRKISKVQINGDY